MPTALARRLCPHGVFLPGSMAKYARGVEADLRDLRRASRRVVEGLSLDEAFLDLTGSERLLGAPRAVGERLRAEVRRETGLAVSVGIAPVKLVAKIASDLAKPDGLLEVAADGVRAFLDPLPVGRLWGVGPVAEARLRRAGFATVGDLARAPARARRARARRLGRSTSRASRAARTCARSRPGATRCRSARRTPSSATCADRAALEAAILAHAEAVARRLRRERLARAHRRAEAQARGARASGTARLPAPHPAHDARRAERRRRGARRRARALLVRSERLREPVRLLGVGVTNLVPAARGQLGLFDAGAARRDRLNRALDALAAPLRLPRRRARRRRHPDPRRPLPPAASAARMCRDGSDPVVCSSPQAPARYARPRDGGTMRGFLLRLAGALALVLATYNPDGHSFTHWLLEGQDASRRSRPSPASSSRAAGCSCSPRRGARSGS